jgi:hypothetical protein
VKLLKLVSGEFVVDIAAAAVKKIRNRPKAVARRAAKAARKARRQRPLDEIDEPFFHDEKEPSMNWTLVIALAGSLLRHFLPWATALLAGMGIQVSPDASPWLTLALAIGVYVAMQAVSFYRQWQKNRTP